MKTSAVLSPKSARALALLKSIYNDVEIFVEGNTSSNTWTKLLQVYLPDGVKLDSVNLLQNRASVVQACKLDQDIDGRKKLYIIDGDLDLLLGVPKPKLRHLYRLRSYCFENYLFDQEAITAAITTKNPNVPRSAVVRQFNMKDWFQRNSQALAGLFICYAVTFELAKDVKTVDYRVRKLLDSKSKSSDLCERKVRLRILALYREVRTRCDGAKVRGLYGRVSANADALGVERFVSGKDYVIPVFHKMIAEKFKVNISFTELKTLIAQCMKGSHDVHLRRRLRMVWRG